MLDHYRVLTLMEESRLLVSSEIRPRSLLLSDWWLSDMRAWTGQGSRSNFIITSAGWPDVSLKLKSDITTKGREFSLFTSWEEFVVISVC